MVFTDFVVFLDGTGQIRDFLGFQGWTGQVAAGTQSAAHNSSIFPSNFWLQYGCTVEDPRRYTYYGGPLPAVVTQSEEREEAAGRHKRAFASVMVPGGWLLLIMPLNIEAFLQQSLQQSLPQQRQ